MTSRRSKPLGRRILANMRSKWAQVMISALAFTIILLVSHKLTVKKKAVTAAEKAKEASEFKFMHCDFCRREMPYNESLANKRAQGCACRGTEVGYWTPTKDSAKAGGDDPLRWFYSAVFVESIVWLAVLYFLLSREDDTPEFFFVKCVHCGVVLRYTASGYDLLVACVNCEQPIRLPDEDESMSREEQDEVKAIEAVEGYEKQLRKSGYRFPGEETVPQEHDTPPSQGQ
jgi:hypothetical protein